MKAAFFFALMLAIPTQALAAGRARGRPVPVRHISGGRLSAPSSRGPSQAPAMHGNPAQARAGARHMASPASRRGSWRSEHGSSFGKWRPLKRPSFVPRSKVPAPEAAPQSEPAPEPQEGPTPVPGALIRTEGLGFKTAPGDPSRFHVIEAGDRIAPEEGKARALETVRGVHQGPKDKLPPPTPGSVGTASGRTAITPNTPFEAP